VTALANQDCLVHGVAVPAGSASKHAQLGGAYQTTSRTMGGCASVLFLPFALCARGTDDADDQGHDPWPATGRTNESRERLQQPPVRSAEKLPLLADSGLQTVDDAVLSAILLHIAVSDDDDGFAQLLRLKARARWLKSASLLAPRGPRMS